MLFDTHAHVNFNSFKEDSKEVLKRALDNGVQVINAGSQIDTSKRAVESTSFFEGIYAVVGLHPEHTHSQFVDEEETHFQTREESFDYESYKKLAGNSKVVGIGECGLDYFRLPILEDGHQDDRLQGEIKQKQKQAFIAQIELAKELDKTLVVHSRSSKGTDDACEDILEIVKRQQAEGSSFRFVLHSYTGSPEVLQKFLNIGAYVSFNGIITFDKTGNMEKLVKLAPIDRIVTETDCPYLTPVPHRGKRNEPLFVQYVAEKIAQIKSLSVNEIADITTNNAKKLFNII